MTNISPENFEKLQSIGKSAYASLVEMVEAYRASDNYSDDDTTRDAILSDALSVQVRSGWCNPGERMVAEEYEILLSTGGPATRIIGRLNDYNEPETAALEVQDWFLPWTTYADADESVLLDYARVFYFGE